MPTLNYGNISSVVFTLCCSQIDPLLFWVVRSVSDFSVSCVSEYLCLLGRMTFRKVKCTLSELLIEITTLMYKVILTSMPKKRFVLHICLIFLQILVINQSIFPDQIAEFWMKTVDSFCGRKWLFQGWQEKINMLDFLCWCSEASQTWLNLPLHYRIYALPNIHSSFINPQWHPASSKSC